MGSAKAVTQREKQSVTVVSVEPLALEGATPFNSIESALEYVEFLKEAAEEARGQMDAEIAKAEEPRLARRREALLLVSYKLAQLGTHVGHSERLLKDLRKLRRLILEDKLEIERTAAE